MNEDLLLRRFLAKVDKRDDGCWLWTGCIVNGYGAISLNRKTVKAHRLSYELFKGMIDAGFDIRHACHVRACVNPDHLSPGSRLDNMRDKMKAGRHRYVSADSEVKAEITRRTWANHTPLERAERVKRVSVALKDKPFTPEHLANLRASPANQVGRPARTFGTALSPEDVLIIRQKYSEGMKQDQLAIEYGLSRGAICQLVRGKSYQWVASGPVERLVGYGTKKRSVYVHGNRFKKRPDLVGIPRDENFKKLHAERMKEIKNHG